MSHHIQEHTCKIQTLVVALSVLLVSPLHAFDVEFDNLAVKQSVAVGGEKAKAITTTTIRGRETAIISSVIDPTDPSDYFRVYSYRVGEKLRTEQEVAGSLGVDGEGQLSLKPHDKVIRESVYDVKITQILDIAGKVIQTLPEEKGTYNASTKTFTAAVTPPTPVVISSQPLTTKISATNNGIQISNGSLMASGITNTGNVNTDTLSVSGRTSMGTLQVGGVATPLTSQTTQGTVVMPVTATAKEIDATTGFEKVYSYRTGEKVRTEQSVAGALSVDANGKLLISSSEKVLSESVYDVRVTQLKDIQGKVIETLPEERGVYDGKTNTFIIKTPTAVVTRQPLATTGGLDLSVLNAAGHTNGVVVTSTKLTLSGGTGTTTQVLDDNGLKITTTDPSSGKDTGVTTIDKNGNTTIGGALNVAGISSTQGLVAGSITTESLSVSGNATVSSLTVTDSVSTKNLSNTGTLTNNGNLRVIAGSGSLTVADKTVIVGVQNAAGHNNGVTANTSSTQISGGTDSTTLTLDDVGASFSKTDGTPTLITGVANGTHTNDAVNYGQFASFRDQLMNQINTAEENLSGGIAGAVAVANMPQLDPRKKLGVNIGFGHYRSSNAFALGVSVRATETIIINGSMSQARSGNATVGVGAGFSW